LNVTKAVQRRCSFKFQCQFRVLQSGIHGMSCAAMERRYLYEIKYSYPLSPRLSLLAISVPALDAEPRSSPYLSGFFPRLKWYSTDRQRGQGIYGARAGVFIPHVEVVGT